MAAVSLGIAFKGPEGIVLAADSRVTLTAELNRPGQPAMTVPATYDNARKLLAIAGQPFAGVVTFGAGAINTPEGPRTAHSFLPDFESELADAGRLRVGEIAQRLSDFFSDKWNLQTPPQPAGNEMVFYVAGYDERAVHGCLYSMSIPAQPAPQEVHAGTFGIQWGGQREIVDRLLDGFDARASQLAEQHLTLDEGQRDALAAHLKQNLSLPIPYQFLPLQDCVDLATLLVRTTAQLQTWTIGIRGVGGAVDVATITRTEGFVALQVKKVQGEEY